MDAKTNKILLFPAVEVWDKNVEASILYDYHILNFLEHVDVIH